MPRYPSTLVERLKNEVAIVPFLEARGCVFQPHGSTDVVCRCPFPDHEDRTPSFVVSPEKNVWHCLGACGVGGTVIDLVMRLDGLEFRPAIEALLRLAPFSLASLEESPGDLAQESEPSARVDLLTSDMDDDAMLRAVMQYYHHRLAAVPDAVAYLERRGISETTAKHFKIGAADRSLGQQIPAKTHRDGRAIRERLQALGLVRTSGHEALTGRIVVPITDAAGRIVQWYGRRWSDGAVPHLYRSAPQAGVFNVAGIIAAPGWCVLCEAILDALTFYDAGFENVTTAYGTNGFTDTILETFQAQAITDVLIAFDRDDAGETGAMAAAQRLRAVGINPWRVQFPSGMDANSYAMSTKPVAKALGLVLKAATWLNDGPAPVSPAARDSAPVQVSEPQTAKQPSETALPKLPEKPEETGFPIASDGSAIWTTADGNRVYRLQGLMRFKSGEQGKITITLTLTGQPGNQRTVDVVDLYQRRHREAFASAAAADSAADPQMVKADLGVILDRLEAYAQENTGGKETKQDPVAAMAPADRAAAEALLRDPNLVDRTIADLERCGLIGENANKLVGLVAMVSRTMQRPLALLIQSVSGAGKTTLMEGLLAFVPEEARVQYSAMTGRSVFYLGDTDLRHKVLALVEEEGAQHASYALKLLQSEGKLTIASTGKDPQSGRMVTHDYTVEGPVMLCLTTTAAEIDDELQNRCLVVGVDEAREQTRAVHDVQRLRCTVQGLVRDTEKKRLTALHQNAQRLLEPVPVVNPYAEFLTFPDHQTRLRRDHAKYLGLIEAITLWHQFQRPRKTVEHDGQRITYIETTLADIALANRLAHQVLGRSVDELAPQTRRLLGVAGAMVREMAQEDEKNVRQVRFTRRMLRERCGWGDTQLKIHVARLVDLEFFTAYREGHRQAACYELAWDGDADDSAPQFGGLMNVEELERTCG